MLFASLVSEQGGVSADRVRKDLIQLAGNAQLVLLKLRETADHERVFEVRGNHSLEKLHVVGAELAEAFVHHAAELAIALTAVFLQALRLTHQNYSKPRNDFGMTLPIKKMAGASQEMKRIVLTMIDSIYLSHSSRF